jgi:hypothetical protein
MNKSLKDLIFNIKKMSEIHVLKEFKNNLISFFDELIDQFPDLGELVMIRIFLNDQVIIKDVVESVSYQINKNDQMIRKIVRDRNEEFFLEENNFFNGLSVSSSKKDKVLKFQTIWRSNRLDKEDKDTIWKWIDSFVFLTDKYNKMKEK